MPRGRQEDRVPTHRNTVLLIPHANERASTVAMIADGVRVHRAINAVRPHLSERAREDLISGQARLHVVEQDVLEPVGVREALSQPGGHFGLSVLHDITHVLGVRVEVLSDDAEVSPQ